MEKSKKFERKCAMCNKVYKVKSTYYTHIKKCNNQNKTKLENKFSGNFVCVEENCTFATCVRLDFLNHLKESHSISCEEEIKIFQSYTEFEAWKENYEKATTSSFRMERSRKTDKFCTVKQFICNRSGKYHSQRTGKRSIKKQGLTKIGRKCTANIKLQFYPNSSKVRATIYGMHYGHDNKIAHLRIPKSERIKIAQQLSMGIEKPKILINTLINNSTDQLERQHLITRKDIDNIQKSFGVKRVEKQYQDDIKADTYTEELEADNSLLLYKKQAENSLCYSNGDSNFLDNDSSSLDGDDSGTCKDNLELDSVTIGENICIISKTSPLKRNKLVKETTPSDSSELTSLKSNLVSRVTALCELIQNCESKDLLQIAKAHIASASSVLKLENVDKPQNSSKKTSHKNVRKQSRGSTVKQKRKNKVSKTSKDT